MYDVNPVTKATLAHLKQFTVVSDISDSTGDITLTMAPCRYLNWRNIKLCRLKLLTV